MPAEDSRWQYAVPVRNPKAHGAELKLDRLAFGRERDGYWGLLCCYSQRLFIVVTDGP